MALSIAHTYSTPSNALSQLQSAAGTSMPRVGDSIPDFARAR